MFPNKRCLHLPPPFAPRGLPWEGVFAKPEKNCIYKFIYVYVYLRAQLSGALRWIFCCCSFPGLTNVPPSSKGNVFSRSSFEEGGLLVVTQVLKQRDAGVSLGRPVADWIYRELLLQFFLLMQTATQVLSAFNTGGIAS